VQGFYFFVQNYLYTQETFKVAEDDKSVVDELLDAINDISGAGMTPAEAQERADALEKLVKSVKAAGDEVKAAEKIKIAQTLKRLELLADENKVKSLILSIEEQIQKLEKAKSSGWRKRKKVLAKEIQDLKKMQKIASKATKDFKKDHSAKIKAIKEELKLGKDQINQLKAIEAIHKKSALKKGSGPDPTGVSRRSAVTLFRDMEATFEKLSLEGVLEGIAAENAILEGITGARGTLFEDYYTAMGPFTNTMDTGFRGIIRSGIKFTGDLKEVFERSIDPIQGFASGEDAELMVRAAENMGGMFTSIGLDGESARVALAALKNNTSFLRDEFIKAGPESEAAAAHFANLTQGLAKLGISEEEVATNLDFFVKGLKQTPKQASESVRALENVAHSLDVNVSQAFSDFTALQGELSQYGDDTIRVFGNLQAQAVATGVSVGDLNSVAERLDTFKGAAQAAQGFNAVLGKTVLSVTDLVHAEPAEKIQLLKDALDKSGISFDTANRRIKKMIAGFMGVDVAKASKIFGSDDDYFTLKDNLDGSASSMEDLDKRVRSSMTNAEKMTATLSNIGIASAHAIDRARENAENSSQALMGIITQMGEAAKGPLDTLTSLRKVLQMTTPAESAVSTATGRVTSATAYLALFNNVLSQFDTGDVGNEAALRALRTIEKIPGVPDFWHIGKDGKPAMGPGKNKFHGGPVSPGQPYIVGENHPGGKGELFVPDQKGTIVSNRDLAAGQNNISIAFNSPLQIVGADGGIVTVGHFNKLFDRKVDNAAFNAPDPVVIA
jgi:hypothetical protein